MKYRASELSDLEKSKEGLVLVEVHQGRSILLVEEDNEVAMSVNLQLELDGFKVDMFTDPATALDKYNKDPSGYSLVIVDTKMVRMPTFEFMRAIKIADGNSKILLITPFEIRSNEFSKVLPASKVNGFVERPHLSTRLITSVKDVLGDPYGDNLKQ
ncbi:MAG: response regulator [Thaumarchaeota archaeon]|nr:response regulator [Nitrososphaerota archaeon]